MRIELLSSSSVVRIASMIALALLLASCQLGARLAIAEGSTAAKLEFVLSDSPNGRPGRLNSIHVFSCVERSGKFPDSTGRVWSAHATNDNALPELGRFAYGHVAGLTTDVDPKPLQPGCYIARAYAKFPDPRQGFVAFRVKAGGDIVAIEAP